MQLSSIKFLMQVVQSDCIGFDLVRYLPIVLSQHVDTSYVGHKSLYKWLDIDQLL